MIIGMYGFFGELFQLSPNSHNAGKNSETNGSSEATQTWENLASTAFRAVGVKSLPEYSL